MPAVSQHELHIDFPLRGTLGTMGFATGVRSRKEDFAVATNPTCDAHPRRRSPLTAHRRYWVRVSELLFPGPCRRTTPRTESSSLLAANERIGDLSPVQKLRVQQ
jgi:hypothetical protein